VKKFTKSQKNVDKKRKMRKDRAQIVKRNKKRIENATILYRWENVPIASKDQKVKALKEC
jgi:hypothetical protein